jgi:hypothetical protein
MVGSDIRKRNLLLMQWCIFESLDQICFREISESKLSLTADHFQQQVPKGFPNSRIAFRQREVKVINERKVGMLVSFWSPIDFEIPSFSG